MALAQWARNERHEVKEVGALGDAAYDYPVASDAVVEGVLSGAHDVGVIICGTGIGVSIRANRHSGIRAANCCSEEMAGLARQHNHANVLCLGARLLSENDAVDILKRFVDTPESQEERHTRRVEMLDKSVEQERASSANHL